METILGKSPAIFNGSEFCQKLIGTIIRVLVRHLPAKSGIKNDKDPYEVKCHIRDPLKLKHIR